MNILARGRAAYLASIAILLLLAFSCTTTSGPTEAALKVEREKVLAESWQALWSDKFSEAEQGFSSIVAKGQGSSVLRGLSLALSARGKGFEALDAACKAFAAEPTVAANLAALKYAHAAAAPSVRAEKAVAGAIALARKVTLPGWLSRELDDIEAEADLNVKVEPSLAKRLAAKNGYQFDWDIYGPLPDIGGLGIDKPYVDESKTAVSALFEKKLPSFDGLEAKKLAVISDPLGWVDPAAWYGTGGWGAVFYARTSFLCSAEGEYLVEADRKGSFKCWVDGKPVASSPADIAAADSPVASVKLDTGAHTILVKLASSDGKPRFRLSLAKADYSAGEAGSAAVKEAAGIDLAVADSWLAALAGAYLDKKGPEQAFWLSLALSARGFSSDALELASGLGDSALLASLRADLLRAAGEASKADALVRKAPASLAESWLPKLSDAERRQDWEGLGTLLGDYEEEFGQTFWFCYYDAKRVMAVSTTPYAAYVQFVNRGADAPLFAFALLNDPRISFPDTAMLVAGMKGSPFGLAMCAFEYELISSGAMKGDFPGLARKLAACRPEVGEYAFDTFQIELFTEGKSPEDFESGLENLAEKHPGSLLSAASMLKGYVDAIDMDRGGGMTRYLSTFKKLLRNFLSNYLSLHPERRDIRDELATLNGSKTSRQIVPPADIDGAISRAADYAGAKGRDFLCAIDSRTDLVWGDGGVMRYRAVAMKVLTSAGAAAFSSWPIEALEGGSSLEVISAYAQKPDGERVRARILPDRASFPGLSPGDFLVLEYRLDGKRSGAFAREYWTEAEMDAPYPVIESDYTLILPKGDEPSFAVHGAAKVEKATRDVATDSVEDPDYRAYSFVCSDAAPAPLSSGADRRDRYTWVDASTLGSWSAVSDWYADIALGRAEPTAAVKAKADELCAGLSSADDKLKALFAYVSYEVDYEDLSFNYDASVPQTAESVLADGFGDCKDKSVLLMAMLKAEGIESSLALCDASYLGDATMLPSTRFNHVFVRARDSGGKLLVLDTTGAYYTFSEMPPALEGAWILPIAADASASTALEKLAPPDGKAATKALVEAKAASGTTSVKGSLSLRGDFAASLRAVLAYGDEELRKKLVEDWIADNIPGFSLASYEARAATTLSEAPTLSFSGTAPGIEYPGVGLKVLRVPLFSALSSRILSLPGELRRGAPIELGGSWFAYPLSQSFVYELGPGEELLSLPADLELSFKGANASFKYKLSSGRIVCDRDIYIPFMSLSAADADGLAAFLQALAAKQAEPLAIRKK